MTCPCIDDAAARLVGPLYDSIEVERAENGFAVYAYPADDPDAAPELFVATSTDELISLIADLTEE